MKYRKYNISTNVYHFMLLVMKANSSMDILCENDWNSIE